MRTITFVITLMLLLPFAAECDAVTLYKNVKTVELTVTTPTINEDNAPLDDLKEVWFYVKYVGEVAIYLDKIVTAEVGTAVSKTVTVPKNGMMTFQASAWDLCGNESLLSPESIQVRIKTTRPKWMSAPVPF
jgi:hypothetical protein